MTSDLRIAFTGRALLILEIEDWGPMEWRFDDEAAVRDLIRVVLTHCGTSFPVGSYKASYGRKLTTMLEHTP